MFHRKSLSILCFIAASVLFVLTFTELYWAHLRVIPEFEASGWLSFTKSSNSHAFIVACYRNDECRQLLFNTSWDNYRIYYFYGFAITFLAGLGLSFYHKNDKLYDGAFLKLSDIKAMWLRRSPRMREITRSSIMLGTLNNKIIGVKPLKTKKELDHTLIVGPTRSGKGLNLISNLLSWKHSAVVVDIKGEMHHLTAGHRSRFNDIFVLDPDGFGSTYDPIQDMGGKTEALFTAAKVIMKAESDGSKSIFAERSAAGFVAAVLAARKLSKPSFPYIKEVTSWGTIRFIAELLKVNDPDVTYYLGQFSGWDLENFNPEDIDLSEDRFLVSTWNTFLTRLRPFLTEGILKTSSGHSISGKALSQKPSTIYLRFSEAELPATMDYLRLLLLSLITAIIKDIDKNPDEHREPILLCFDEAGRVPIPLLDDLVSTISGRGLTALIYIQDLSQLDNNYGRSAAKTIRGNCQTQVYYAPADLDTATYISDLAGSHMLSNKQLQRQSRNIFDERQFREEFVKRELMTPDEVMQQLTTEDILIFRRNQKPIKAKRLKFFKERWLKSLVAVPSPPVKEISYTLTLPDMLQPPPAKPTEEIPLRVIDDAAQDNSVSVGVRKSEILDPNLIHRASTEQIQSHPPIDVVRSPEDSNDISEEVYIGMEYDN